MSDKFRVGVIGCGAIADRLHVPDYATCEHAEVVALCDADVKRARAVADHWAPNAAVHSDHNAMLRDENLDAVSVCLPNFLHASVTIDALKAGCHVLVEKPMAASLDEAKAMVAAAKKAKKLLMVNQSQRLLPAHIKAKEVLASGLLGKILQVNGMFGHRGPEHWSPTGKWFFNKKHARFGAMADLGVHKADIIRFMSGREVSEVSAFVGNLEKKNSSVDDNFCACFQFEGGGMGTFGASWTIKGMDCNYTMFHCENGSLRVYQLPDKPLVAHLLTPECTIEFPLPKPVFKYEGSWGVDAGGSFVRACLGLEAPFCKGEDGLKSLELILAAEKAALSGRVVKLKH
jgi:UDP-N-acetylglucosamine 3-dehydrogenase